MLANTAVASYLYVNRIAPLFWALYSDLQGTRRKLIALHMLQFFSASAVQCLSVGTLSDIYSATEKENAIGVFYLGFFIRPVIGLPIGRFLT
ncbi:major facilitator superfamily domain-containing protein [Rhizophagus clarus]|uniref:Major facilitator superfamily domain-containing protein n=1 Tax=Rhizophagus clarus TaxID=94130 RepID=A0A8H3LKL1_9GLOM|nr:major facilitator superfamily domain-containing protein [Rhizophagus clarus]